MMMMTSSSSSASFTPVLSVGEKYLQTASPEQLAALKSLARFVQVPKGSSSQYLTLPDHAHRYYYIPETEDPIQLLPHQQSIFNYAFAPENTGRFTTFVYSTVKKSGKTALAAMVARWAAETWGKYSEILCVANDYEQAKGRVYAKFRQSIELDPRYDSGKRMIPDHWKIIEKEALHIPTQSVVRAISGDYAGAAGANPNLTIWTELWAYKLEASRRLWDELTPVPTRERSMRYVETYAGFTGESDILEELWRLAQDGGRRLTHDEIDWPFPDQPPIWVNERARLFAYIDQGEVAHRMPWQTPEYYSEESASLRPEAYERLHLNYWTYATKKALPIQWWDRLYDPTLASTYPLQSNTPLVIGVDAGTTRDCTAAVAFSRHPDPARHQTDLIPRWALVWKPSPGEPINFSETLEPALRLACETLNVVNICYDPTQLHHLMTNLRMDGVAWCEPFNQGHERAIADSQLYTLIRDKHIAHAMDPTAAYNPLRDHLNNCSVKMSKDEDTNMRFVKAAAAQNIDAAVAASMSSSMCLYLNLDPVKIGSGQIASAPPLLSGVAA